MGSAPRKKNKKKEPKENGVSFENFVKDTNSLWKMIAAAGASSVLVGMVVLIGPPWPSEKAIGLLTAVFQFPIYILCFVFFLSGSKPQALGRVRKKLKYAIPAFFVVTAMYLIASAFLLIRLDSFGNTEARGFLTEEAIEYKVVEPASSDADLLRAFGGDSEIVFTKWSLMGSRSVLLILWFLTFGNLSYILCLFVIHQHLRKPNRSEVDKKATPIGVT